MVEFMTVMADTAGTEMSYAEADDCRFLMETLLGVSENELFKSQLRESLRVLRNEMASLRN